MTVLTRIREVAVHRRDNRTDWILLGAMVALSAFGLLMIYSATRSCLSPTSTTGNTAGSSPSSRRSS